MELYLKDKVFVVNGGTKGLGKAVVIGLCREGARVVFSGRDENDSREVLDEVKSTDSEAKFVETDIRRVSECEELIKSAEDYFGKIDGLVNYAGITSRGSITEIEENIFYDIFDTNFKSAFFCCKYAIRSMIKTGGGSIVNVGSTMGYGGIEEMSAYACSKGAMLTLTKHIANNYAGHNIRANWITMGWVATPNEIRLFKSAGRDKTWLDDQAKEVMPMGRLQTEEDNVPGILYLLSLVSSQVTGTELHISGGYFPGAGRRSAGEM